MGAAGGSQEKNSRAGIIFVAAVKSANWKGFSASAGPAGGRPARRSESTGEAGGQRDLDAGEGLGDGAPFLGLLRVLLEGGLVEARHLGLVVELDAGDLEPVADLLE